MLLLFLGCWSVEQLCAGAGPSELTIGRGEGSDFVPLEPGEELEIAEPPQGGSAVPVWMSTFGLASDNVLQLDLSTELEGEVIAEFHWENAMSYCQGDGSGLVWGIMVPVDEDQDPSDAALDALDGKTATLRIFAEDVRGDAAEGEAEVILRRRQD